MQLPVDCVVSLGCGSEPRVERSKGLSTVGGGSEAVAVDGCICRCQAGGGQLPVPSLVCYRDMQPPLTAVS